MGDHSLTKSSSIKPQRKGIKGKEKINSSFC